MASYYNTSTLAATAASYATWFGAAMLACGWTVWDTVGNFSGNSHKVYKAPDVNGVAGVSFFVDLSYQAGAFTINGCIDWDPTTHTAISSSTQNGSGVVGLPGGTGYIYCNQLGFTFYVADGLYESCGFVGQPRCRQTPGVSDGMSLATGAITAGATSIPINTANAGNQVYTGQILAIQNFGHDSTSANKDHRELVTVTAGGSGSFHVSAVANNYDAGAKIGPPDMLYPVGTGGTAFQSYNGAGVDMSTQAIGLNQAGTITTCRLVPALTADSGTYAGLVAGNAAGLPAEAFTMLLTQNETSDFSSALPVSGILAAYIKFAAGAPATGTPFDTGTGVFMLVKGGVGVGGSHPSLLIGPTGDPSGGGQAKIYPPQIPVADSIYSNPPAAVAAPPNALNQGLN